MTKKLTVFVMLMISAMTIFSQEKKASAGPASGGKEDTERLLKLQEKLEGTYQLQIFNSRSKVMYPLGVLDDIEARRQDNDTVFYKLDNNMRFVILPRKIINTPGFKKLSPTILYAE
ncbi:MAG: hypothetical protein ACXVC6_01915 [Bacteroidia bacterium]